MTLTRLFTNSRIRILGKLIVTLTLLAILFSLVDFDLILRLMPRINVWLFFLSFVILCSRNFFAAWRWQTLLQSGNYNFSIWSLTIYYFISYFCGFLLPTVVGGDIVRGYYLYNSGVGKDEAASSVLVERILGISAVMGLALVGILFGFRFVESNSIKILVIIINIVGLVSISLVYYRRASLIQYLSTISNSRLSFLFDLIQSCSTYQKKPYLLVRGFLLSILFQLAGIISIYLLGLSIGAGTPFIYFLILMPIVWLISMIPISLNGLGLREGTFLILFVSIGMTREMAITISGLSLILMIFQGILGGLFFLADQKDISSFKTNLISS